MNSTSKTISSSQAPQTSTNEDENSRTRFANRALWLIGSASIVVFILEILERQELISRAAESAIRLVVCTTILTLLIRASRRLAKKVKIAVVVCVVFLELELCFEFIEDIAYLNSLPFLGHDSDWRHAVEKLIVACWMCSGFYLLYALIHQLDESYNNLLCREEETKLSNQKLAQALDELKTTQSQIIRQERLNAFGQMASGVAHDLNNALTPVVAVSRTLKQKLPTAHREAFELIQSGAEYSAQVVKQLQHFYQRNDSDEREIVNLAKIVRKAIALTRFRWDEYSQQRDGKIKVDLNLQEECFVRGNTTELLQLLINLLLNAVDSIQEGGRIRISITNNQEHNILVVSDDGCGMSEEDLAHCFEPFYSTRSQGSGLGLSVCHGIVQRHSGRIQVENNANRGARFVISLPACLNDGIEEISNEEQVSLNGKRILCIDDNASVRRAMSILFRPTGIKLETAVDGPDGLARLRSSKYDLLLTDLGMEEMSGRDVVTSVKSKYPDLPVAVLSGWSRDRVLLQFKDGPQPDFVLEKPVKVHEVTACLAGNFRDGIGIDLQDLVVKRGQ